MNEGGTPDGAVEGGNFGSQPAGTTIQSLKNTVLKSHGRPPWYDEDGRPIYDAFVIGIAGGSASGKTHVARQIVQSLGSIPTVVILSQDSFYKRHTREEIALAMENKYDFDHPDALDMPMFAQCLMDLKKCRQTNVPVYSFTEHQRLDKTQYLYGASIIIAEGIMALHDPALRAIYDLKVFVQCDSDLMLARRIRRDVKERGRSVEGVLDQYLRYVKPAYDNFVLPTSRYADIIVPGSDNHVAIELISTHIHKQLGERARHFRPKMMSRRSTCVSLPAASMSNSSEQRYSNLILLPQTPQLKGIYTILRDETVSKQDFIFFVDRLATLLIEAAVELLPFRPRQVETPCGVETPGKELDASCVCGVTVLRSGGPLERGLQRVVNDAPLGSLLVQTDVATSEPLLLHVMLPVCIRDRTKAQDAWIFLLDAQIGTAASAFMAIRVLLDHGVRQDHIVFVTFLVAGDGGISILNQAFPQVRIVTGAVDAHLRELWVEDLVDETEEHVRRRKVWVIEPGMGQIGDRYYL